MRINCTHREKPCNALELHSPVTRTNTCLQTLSAKMVLIILWLWPFDQDAYCSCRANVNFRAKSSGPSLMFCWVRMRIFNLADFQGHNPVGGHIWHLVSCVSDHISNMCYNLQSLMKPRQAKSSMFGGLVWFAVRSWVVGRGRSVTSLSAL